MSTPVTVVDYGIGNLLSVCRALEASGASVNLTGDAQAIAAADRLVLPGVGAFGKCSLELRNHGLWDSVLEFAASDRPLMGICVGMQLLFESGEEFGTHPGLGLIAGVVRAIDPKKPDGGIRKIPHIGWNRLEKPAHRTWQGTILEPITEGESVYFVHSFAGNPTHPEDVLATTEYEGTHILAAVQRGNLTGTQFHPEKSGRIGLTMVERFLNL